MFLLGDDKVLSSINRKILKGTTISCSYLLQTKEEMFDNSSHIYYVVSEYCSLGNLSQFIHKNADLSHSFIINTFSDILRGLINLHDQNIIYGNLKPENVVFNAEGKIFLTDWSLNNFIKKYKKG